MSVPTLTATELGPADAGPLLLLGPSLGTGASLLWRDVVPALARHFHVVAWDLPGHGGNRVPAEAFSVADLAAGVVAVADRFTDGPFAHAGVSVGGATGLHLALDHAERLTSLAVLASAAVLGTPEAWHERAALVRAEGTGAVRDGSRQRWFAEGFADARPEVAAPLLDALLGVDPEGYAQVCEALAGHDVRDRLGEVAVPLLELLGAEDPVAPPSGDPLPGTRVVLDGVSHLPPAEAPAAVAAALLAHLGAGGVTALTPGVTTDDVHAAGMAVRREVLGAAHVDRATAAARGLPEGEFQRFITQYAWGGIWTRPGLDRRSRSMVVLTALMARGHDAEFAMHVRAAITNGLTEAEIVEVVLQNAIYLGVPDANHALRLVRQALEDSLGA